MGRRSRGGLHGGVEATEPPRHDDWTEVFVDSKTPPQLVSLLWAPP